MLMMKMIFIFFHMFSMVMHMIIGNGFTVRIFPLTQVMMRTLSLCRDKEIERTVSTEKAKEHTEKGVHSEDEYEDLFVDEDVDAIDRSEAQMLKEIVFGKEEEARQKMEKVEKKLSLSKRRE